MFFIFYIFVYIYKSMKKGLFLMIVGIIVILTSCGTSSTATETTDSTAVVSDTTVVLDTTVIVVPSDTLVIKK